MKNELELLNKIKAQLLAASIDGMKIDISWGTQINVLRITSDEWHKIFKTDEYNEMKNGRGK